MVMDDGDLAVLQEYVEALPHESLCIALVTGTQGHCDCARGAAIDMLENKVMEIEVTKRTNE